jgi:hypothetical protein
MKLAFLLLVLVNVVLFAWQQGVFGRYAERGREPERLARQIEAERIRVLTEKDAQDLRDRASQTKAAVDATATRACVEFGDFAPPEGARAEAALAALALNAKATLRSIEMASGYLTYLPPAGTRADADRRVDELRKLGAKDAQVIAENGPLRFAISLGSFRDAEAARAHLNALEKQGIKGARISDKPMPITGTRFILRDVDAASMQKLATLRKDFPAQALRTCTP